MKFEVTILGCGSATPTMRHCPTRQLVNYNEQYLLLDCGEGTQLQLRKYQIKLQRIHYIFITHLHGDHCLGLSGLLSTFHLLGRTREIHIYAHSDLQSAVELQLKVSQSWLRYPVIWHALNYTGENEILATKAFRVLSFPLKHGVPTCGFRIEEMPQPFNIRAEVIAKYKLAPSRIRQIKSGQDLTLEDGQVIPNRDLTYPLSRIRSYAFCTDTAFVENTAKFVSGASLLYHESTFLESESDRAKETLHSTAVQAATIAKMANVGTLLLGHYSARYRQDDAFVNEAKPIFDQVFAANEGMTFPVE